MPAQSKTSSPRQRNWRMLIAAGASIAVLALYFWLLSIFIDQAYQFFLAGMSAAYIVVLACVIYIDQPKGFNLVKSILWVTAIFAFLFGIGVPPRGISDKAKEAEAKQNLRLLQLACDKYLEQHGVYPASLEPQAIEIPLGHNYPANPLAQGDRQMRPIPFGAPEPYGDFTYLPVYKENELTGYYLLGYGSERTRGIDVDGDGEGDHVIMILSSQTDIYDPMQPVDQPVGDLPALTSLLKADGAL
ncbi:hypothetical protein JW859_06465 [bacterium]|nr:hypothetical protein [bacterium]